MIQLKEASLEFQEEHPEESQQPPARNHYRVQVRDRDHFFLDFQSKCYPLLDLSEGGVCIKVAPRKSLALDGFLSHCILIAGEEEFHGLEGRVVHYSMGTDSDWTCGIQWTNLSSQDRSRLGTLIAGIRKEMFSHE